MTKQVDMEAAKLVYQEYQQTTEQLKQYEEHVQNIKERIRELQGIVKNIDEIKKVEKGTEMLVPISNGIFIRTTALETSQFLVNVGSKAVVEHTPEQVQELLRNQYEELITLQEKMITTKKQLEEQAEKLQQKLQEMM